jgi:methyl-accepting chemotaxis protein
MAEERSTPGPVADLLQSFQHMASLITQAASDAAQAAATAGAHVTPDFLAGPLGELAEGVAGLSETLTGPLHKLLEEQQRLAVLMSEWSEQHRKMSEQVAAWAEEYRRMTEQMQRIVKPLLEQTEGMARTSRIFVEELRR